MLWKWNLPSPYSSFSNAIHKLVSMIKKLTTSSKCKANPSFFMKTLNKNIAQTMACISVSHTTHKYHLEILIFFIFARPQIMCAGKEFLTIMTQECGRRAGIWRVNGLHLIVSENCCTRTAMKKKLIKRFWKNNHKLPMKVDEAMKEIYEDWFRIE